MGKEQLSTSLVEMKQTLSRSHEPTRCYAKKNQKANSSHVISRVISDLQYKRTSLSSSLRTLRKVLHSFQVYPAPFSQVFKALGFTISDRQFPRWDPPVLPALAMSMFTVVTLYFNIRMAWSPLSERGNNPINLSSEAFPASIHAVSWRRGEVRSTLTCFQYMLVKCNAL